MLDIVSKYNSNTWDSLEESYRDEEPFEKKPIEATIRDIEDVCPKEMLTW